MEWIRQKRKENLKAFGGKCDECGAKKGLQFHHIEQTPLFGRGRGSYARVADVISHPKAYRLLCSSCHVKLHSGTL